MATVKLVWTPGAVRDLEQIHAYIAADAPRYADVVAGRIVQAFERLLDFPESGRVVPELAREDVRELLHGAYRLCTNCAATVRTSSPSITAPAASRTCASASDRSQIAVPLATCVGTDERSANARCARNGLTRSQLNCRR